MSNINELPEEEIYVNTSVGDVCQSLKNKVSSLNLSAERIHNDFKVFTDNGILTNYVTCLATAVNSISATIDSISSTINQSASNQVDLDNQYNTGIVDGTVITGQPPELSSVVVSPEDSTSSYTGGTYTGGTTTGGSSSVSTGTTVQKITVDDIKVDSDLSVISLTDLALISAELLTMIGKNKDYTLNAILDDEDLLNELKKSILQNVNIGSDVRGAIESMDINTFKQSLINISNEALIDIPDSLDVYTNYLKDMCALAKCNVSDLMDESNKDNLKEFTKMYYSAISKLNDVCNNGTMSSKLNILKICAGEEVEGVTKEEQGVIGLVVKGLSELNKNEIEEYVVSNKLVSDVSSLESSRDFFKDLIRLDSKSMQDVVTKMV